MNFLKNVSIFKKLLIAPGITILFFIIFLIFTYTQHTLAQENLTLIKKSIQPRFALANKNIVLFDSIHKSFSDAVAAREINWIKSIKIIETELILNFKLLRKDTKNLQKIIDMQDHFTAYFKLVNKVSVMLIVNDNMALKNDNNLIPKMISLKNHSESELLEYKNFLKNNFDNNLEQTSKALNNILFLGLILGIISIFISVFITFLIALPIRKSLASVVSSISALAQKKPDFSKKLYHATNDEIGKFVDAFNEFSLKVKQDYLALELTRKELEIEKIKAEKATKFKSMFLANMSHEIRTPMNGIIGMTYLVKQTQLNEEQFNYVNKIETSSNLLLSVINDILDLSKIEAGMLDINKFPTNLKDVVQSVFTLLEDSAKNKGLNFSSQMDKVKNINVNIDGLRISQILTNLLSNAIKFTSEGYVKFSIVQKDRSYKFIVEDSGIGLSEEQQTKLFQSFTQADESTTREFGGTGLGLSICKQLVEMMDGHLWVESKIGEGSSFIFELDFEICEENEIEAHILQDVNLLKQKLNELKDITILLVEDNEMNTEVLHSVLKRFPIKIIDASDGSIAVDMYKKYRDEISLIFMDLQMPVMDGYKASALIREFDKEIPIIALSANAFEDDISKSKQSGMNEHINKPIVIEELFTVILEFLDNTFTKNRQNNEKPHLKLSSLPHSLEVEVEEHLLIKQSYATSMGKMIDVMAHQWKQPLNIINMRISQLLLDYEDEMIDEDYINNFQKKSLNQIRYLVQTLNDFRSFMSPHNTKQIFGAQEMLRASMTLIRDELELHNIKVDIDKSQDFSINAIENEFIHIVLNILNNAKEVLILKDIQNPKIKIEIDSDSRAINILDNGLGIDEEHLESIFDLNFTSKKTTGGSGLGLYMSKILIQKYGGDIRVENVENGARFSILNIGI